VRPSRYHLAFISPLLISLLNLSSSRPSSMALKPLTLVLTTPATPPRRSPGPYKRRAPPQSSPHLFQPLFASLHTPAFLSPSAAASPFCTVVAPPPHRRPSSGETRAEFPSLPSPFYAPAGEHWCTRATGGQAPVSVPSCPLSAPASVHGGPSTPASPRRCEPGPWIYPLENNSLFGLFGIFAKRSLDFCKINPRSRFCTQTPRVFGN
jgi:hypothetical protein